MKNSHVTPVKILKGVLVIALGVAVYFTERSLRNKVKIKINKKKHKNLYNNIIKFNPQAVEV